MARNHVAVAQSLLDRGAAIKADKTGWTPLHLAAGLAELNITNRLLDLGADINARTVDGSTSLHVAIQPKNGLDEQQRLEEIKLLLGRGAAFATNDQGWTSLHLAAQNDYAQIVALFLNQGKAIDAQTDKGFTALHIAIFNDSVNTVELLMSRGADVSIPNRSGLVALHIAVQKGSLTLVQSIVERNCNVNAITERGLSLLHYAIARGSGEVVEYVIQSGADMNAMDCYGMTCSNWLKRLRPNLKVPQLANQETGDISFGPKMAVLKRTLLDLATRIKEGKAKSLSDFNYLAHCFLLNGMADDARLAYQQRVLLQGDPPTDVPCCDTCRANQTKFDPFFVCKTCPDTDLCERCMEKYDTDDRKDVLKICGDHEFLRVVASEAEFLPTDTEAFDQWLDRIVEEFKDA